MTRSHVAVTSGRRSVIDLAIELLILTTEITVSDSLPSIDPTRVGAARDTPSFTSGMPLSGHDAGSLISLIPGAVVTPFAIGDGGQFTVNGERPNLNTFRVDGISTNTGVGSLALPGSESGSRPGEQVEIEARSGGNEVHGSVFGYARPHPLNGYDWFAQSCDASLPRASSSGEGVSLGGPLARDRTFFFASFQQSFVSDSAMQLTAVPSLASSADATSGLRQLLKAYPAPTGCHFDTADSIATVGFRNRASVSSYSLRIDQAVGANGGAFLRVQNAPSHSYDSGLDNRNDAFGWQTATAGFTLAHPGWGQEARLNFSHASSRSDWYGTTQAQLPVFQSLAPLLPLNNAQASVVNGFAISGLGEIESGAGGSAYQNQWEASYSLSRSIGSHRFQAGGDYTRLSPRRNRPLQTVSLVSPSVESLVSGGPLGVTVSSMWPEVANIQIGSLFLQDNMRVTSRLSMLYGFRWEWTPPVAAQEVSFPFIGTWNGPGSMPVQLGSISNVDSARWPSSKWQIAPRLALAYAPFKSGFVLRLAGGTFYDTSLGSVINPLAPGGKQLNPSAFAITSTGDVGVLPLGRNAFVGDPLFQVDARVQRELLLGRIGITISLTAFNLLNHPSFANPVALLQNPFFGESASMANLMLGSGTPNTGVTPMFQAGGPRTFEIGCHLSF
ncbi:MAG TPA: TonB-dependent receptor [Bryobacteraceae bacterium]|nr:TonB-dependent receptor [Bryobacteraceae bacterium]